jgi:hypothetical protein
VTDCECHHEATDSHESCCGHEDGRSPDCPIHGDGSGPRARLYSDRIDNTVFGWPR